MQAAYSLRLHQGLLHLQGLQHLQGLLQDQVWTIKALLVQTKWFLTIILNDCRPPPASRARANPTYPQDRTGVNIFVSLTPWMISS